MLHAFLLSGGFVAFLWWLLFMAWGLDLPYRELGVRPGEPEGLFGILFAPLIHGDWEHLIANTPPLLLLGTLLIYSYPRAWQPTIVLIWGCAGIGTWLIGSPAVHIGASGLTHGMMFYLFVTGVIRRDGPAMAISMAVFFLYGGMLMTIVPRDPGVSWESHLSGAIGGLLAAALFARLDPRPPEKHYEWEQEGEERDDPLIGDLWKYTPEELEEMARRGESVDDEEPIYLVGDDDDDEPPPRLH